MIPRNIRYACRVLPFILGFLLFEAMRLGEGYVLPVVKDFRVEAMSFPSNAVDISGSLRKVRDCAFVGVFVTMHGDLGVDKEVKLLFMDLPASNTNRPQGVQDWGPWRVFFPVEPDVHTLSLSVAHQCHSAWLTITKLTDVPLIREHNHETN